MLSALGKAEQNNVHIVKTINNIKRRDFISHAVLHSKYLSEYHSLGSTGSLSNASTPNAHSCTR